MGSSFIRIPAGRFLIGSDDGHVDEQPVHRVWIDRSRSLFIP